jgi:hypothetical protein
MGKSAAEKIWEQYAAELRGTPPKVTAPAKKAPSAPRKPAVKKVLSAEKIWEQYAAELRGTPPKVTAPAKKAPSAPRKPAVKKEVLSAENAAALCRNQPPPCPPGCVQYLDKKKGLYHCRAKPVRLGSKVSTPQTKTPSTPTGQLLPGVNTQGSRNVNSIRSNTSTPTKPTGQLLTGVNTQSSWNVNVVPAKPVVRPPKVPIFAKPIQVAKKNVLDLPAFAPNTTWSPMPPPPPRNVAPKPKKNVRPNYNIEEGLFGLFDEQIEEAVDDVIHTPAGETMSEKLRKELIQAHAVHQNGLHLASNENQRRAVLDISAAHVESKYMDRDDVKLYISLRTLTAADKLREMTSEVQRIHEAVARIFVNKQKISSANVPVVNDLINNHNLCKLINHTAGKLLKTTGEHTVTYLRELCRIFNLKGCSVAPKGELCFMIADYVVRSERDYAKFFFEARGKKGETEVSHRLSNITKSLENVSRAARGTAAPKVKSECATLEPPCPEYCQTYKKKDGNLGCRAKKATKVL